MMSNYDTEIVIYQSEDGQTKVDVRFEDETVWLSQLQAILPVILGGICMLVSGPAGIGLLYAFKSIGVTGETMANLPASFFTAFFVAGGVEVLFKFLAIIITIAILKNSVIKILVKLNCCSSYKSLKSP